MLGLVWYALVATFVQYVGLGLVFLHVPIPIHPALGPSVVGPEPYGGGGTCAARV